MSPGLARTLVVLPALADRPALSSPPLPPRSYTCQAGFAQKHMPEYPLFKLTALLYQVVPDILKQTGKVCGGGWRGCTSPTWLELRGRPRASVAVGACRPCQCLASAPRSDGTVMR